MDDKILCPYCGGWMKPDRTFKSMLLAGQPVSYWRICGECGAKSPIAESREEAIVAAQRRYQAQNRMLTLEEVDAHCTTHKARPLVWENRYSVTSPRWMYAYTDYLEDEDDISITNLINDPHIPCYRNTYGKRWRAWTEYPTDEERAAVPWEEDC